MADGIIDPGAVYSQRYNINMNEQVPLSLLINKLITGNAKVEMTPTQQLVGSGAEGGEFQTVMTPTIGGLPAVKNADGTYSVMVGDKTHGGYATVPISVDPKSGVAQLTKPDAITYSPGADVSLGGFLKQAALPAALMVAAATLGPEVMAAFAPEAGAEALTAAGLEPGLAAKAATAAAEAAATGAGAETAAATAAGVEALTGAGATGSTVAQQVALMEANGMLPGEIATALQAGGMSAADASVAAGLSSGVPGTALASAYGGAAGAAGAGAGGAAGAGAAGAGTGAKAVSPWLLPAVIGSNLIGAAIQAKGAETAAETQTKAATEALNLQKDIYNKNLALAQPWITAGTGMALPALTAGLTPGGQFNKPYTLADFQAGPQAGLYKFARGEALSALGNRAAAGGQAQSTGTTIGAGKLATDLASQYYNTGFNENLAQNQLALGGLQSLAGLSQTQTTAAQNAGTNLATQSTPTLKDIGNVQAAADVAKTNALSNVVSGFGRDLSTLPGAMQALANLFA